MTNILVLSSGTRNKIVQYFKNSLTDSKGNRIGQVIATDMSNLAPSIYDADKHFIVPRMTTDGYIDIILDICEKEKVTGVLSLIDPELSLLAKYRDDFKNIGTTVIGSDYKICEMALDKMEMYKFCTEHGYNTAKSWNDRYEFYKAIETGDAKFPVFVKPQRGSASIAISKVYDKETVDILFNHEDPDAPLMIQEFLDGQEIGVDCYIDMISGELVSAFSKKKLVMRAGETDKAVSFKDDKLFNLVKEFCKDSGYRGQIDIDIFDVDGEYYISEVNPRFGGGYPHAYEAGVDHMSMIVNNLEGRVNKPIIGEYEDNIYMMKYVELMVR